MHLGLSLVLSDDFVQAGEMGYSYFYVFAFNKYVGKADVVMAESFLMEFADGSSDVEDDAGRILFLFY